MKPKQLKHITISLAIIISFFLGRESNKMNTLNKLQPNYFTDSLQKTPHNTSHQDNLLTPLQRFDDDTIVYRCGHSKIYHPTKTHASFKNCKSKIYELTVIRAKELGMRHCKCSH